MVTYDYSGASKEARVHSNLGHWNKQRRKLLEFAYNLVEKGLERGEVLDRTQTWNTAQTISFLPFYVRERVNLAWRRAAKKRHLVKRCSTDDNNRGKQTTGELNESSPKILEEVVT